MIDAKVPQKYNDEELVDCMIQVLARNLPFGDNRELHDRYLALRAEVLRRMKPQSSKGGGNG